MNGETKLGTDNVTITCKEMFRRTGPERMDCNKMGEWSEDPTTQCVPELVEDPTELVENPTTSSLGKFRRASLCVSFTCVQQ